MSESFADEMLRAADVLETLGKRFEYLSPAAASFCALDLRAEAKHVAAEDAEAEEREAWTEELARTLFQCLFPDADWERRLTSTTYAFRERAHLLIESGWRKGEPSE